MEYVVTALYLAAFLYLITRLPLFRTAHVPARVFMWIFVAKVLAGIGLGILYKYYFNGGDTHTYFRNAIIMHGFIHEDVSVYFKMLFAADDPALRPFYKRMLDWDNLDYFYNDSHTIVRLNALLRLFSFGIYNVHVIFFSFFSLTGLACLYKCFLYFLPSREKALLIAVFLTPSILFWSSGILKEGLLLFGLGVLFYSKLQMIYEGKKYYVVAALPAILMLLFLKVYVLILLFPGIIAWMWSARSPAALTVLKFFVSYLAAATILLSARLINPNLNGVTVIYWKQVNSVNLSEAMQSKSKIHPPLFRNNLASLLVTAPAAFFKTLIQPTFAQAHNPFSAMAATENAILLLLLLAALLFASRPPPQAFPLFMVCLIFAFLLFALIGLTTANAGSLVRYKMPALPFLLFVVIALFDPAKLKSRLGIKK